MPETKTMDSETTKRYVLQRTAIIVAAVTVLTGLVVFVSQYFQTNNRLDTEARNRTVKIAEEVKAAVMEYPAHDWLILYWHDHAKELDIEYDATYGKGTETEKKARELTRRHPELELKYATEKDIRKLSPKDQKLYAEVTYSWLITRLDQIKRIYKMEFLYGALEKEPFNPQFFLFSAADKGAVRGTEFNQVYTLGVAADVTEVQQSAMKLAATTGEHLAMENNYVDYYSLITTVGEYYLLVGMTYDLSALMDTITAETVSGTMLAMLYQVLLAALLLVFTWIFVIRPLMEQFISATADKERISAELSLATDIQASMLPHVFPPFPERTEIDLYASMDPAREVGGDFYDFFFIDEDHLGIAIADVSGKGVPAALFMMESKIILENNAMQGCSPAEILQMTNEAICANNTMEMFVSVWLGILELSTGKLTAANAGHEYPVLTNEAGEFELLKDKHGLVIGGMDGVRFREYELQLAPGAKIFVYTDGVPEATDANEEMFGTERMVDALNLVREGCPQEILSKVREKVDEFVGEAEQFDDLTMLCLEYKGGRNGQERA